MPARVLPRVVAQEDAASFDYDIHAYVHEDMKAAAAAMQKLRSICGVDEGFIVQAEVINHEDKPHKRLQLAAELVESWRPHMHNSFTSTWASLPAAVKEFMGD